MMKFFDEGGVGRSKELIELRFIRQAAHVKAAHFGKHWMSIEELDQTWDGLDAFKMLDDEGTQHGMAGIAGAANAGVSVANRGEIEGLKDQMIFPVKIGSTNNVLKIIEKREKNLFHFYPPFLF